MQVTIRAYDVLGLSLVVTVAATRSDDLGVDDGPATFLSRSQIPLTGIDARNLRDILWAIAEELANAASYEPGLYDRHDAPERHVEGEAQQARGETGDSTSL